jgi:hypothetical protein
MFAPAVEELRSLAHAVPSDKFLEAAGWKAASTFVKRLRPDWLRQPFGLVQAAAEGEFLRAFSQAIVATNTLAREANRS